MPQRSGSSSSRRSGPSDRSGKGAPKRGDSAASKKGDGKRPASKGRSQSKGNRSDSRSRRADAPKPTPRAERSGWGSVAQHGAAGATIGQRVSEQEAGEQFSPDEKRKFQERQAKRDKITARSDGLREQARQAIERGGLADNSDEETGREVTVERGVLRGRPPKPMHVERELERQAGKEKGQRAWRLYKRAGREFENEQFTDSRKTIKPLSETYPNIADLRELHGLTLYRLGKWSEAVTELELFRTQSGTAEQHPVLMDCHRALGHWADVDELWAELGELSPSAELVSEGRIVAAGAQADRGFIDSGVRILEKGWKVPSEPMMHHLRRAYALADLLERDGKIPKSRKLFAWVASKAPDFGDAAERSAN